MSRFTLIGAAVVALTLLLVAPSTAASPSCARPAGPLVIGLKKQVACLKKQVASLTAENARLKSNRVRFDITEERGAIIPGGTAVAKDAGTGETISLTASGEARPSAHKAAGGGTFARSNGATTIVSGIWYVTGFVSWTPAGGTVGGAVDGIGQLSEASAGLLVLNVHLVPDAGAPSDGTLTVHCNLGVDEQITGEEGVSLTIGSLRFEQAGGATLFHRGGS